MHLPPLERIPRSVTDGRRLARRIGDPKRQPDIGLRMQMGSPGTGMAHADGLEAMAALLPDCRGSLDLVWLEADAHASDDGNASAWLTQLAAQLTLARRLLRKQGELWVNIDWRHAQSTRLLLDALYGADAFAAEIAWRPLPSLQRTVLAYRKQGRQRRGPDGAHDDSYIRERFPNVEAATGRRYWLDLATWRHDPAELERMKAEGRIVTSKAGVPYIKRYCSDGA